MMRPRPQRLLRQHPQPWRRRGMPPWWRQLCRGYPRPRPRHERTRPPLIPLLHLSHPTWRQQQPMPPRLLLYLRHCCPLLRPATRPSAAARPLWRHRL